MSDEELDVGLLMWDVSMRVDPVQFGPGQTVIKFEFSDEPRLKKGDLVVRRMVARHYQRGERPLCSRPRL